MERPGLTRAAEVAAIIALLVAVAALAWDMGHSSPGGGPSASPSSRPTVTITQTVVVSPGSAASSSDDSGPGGWAIVIWSAVVLAGVFVTGIVSGVTGQSSASGGDAQFFTGAVVGVILFVVWLLIFWDPLAWWGILLELALACGVFIAGGVIGDEM
ncbi:hypothetical protein [Microbispora sp. NPDC049125]|uniref:hypothetical protein n=1 Tax=Microbispora sp. NPDC049125 TaxID=3154929 RepID=UPI003466C687